jgi:hypothetical protein
MMLSPRKYGDALMRSKCVEIAVSTVPRFAGMGYHAERQREST